MSKHSDATIIKSYRDGEMAANGLQVGDQFTGAFGAADAAGYSSEVEAGEREPSILRRLFVQGFLDTLELRCKGAGVTTRGNDDCTIVRFGR